MLISIAVLHGPDEQRKGFVLVGRDITDIRLAELELRRSEERYRDILESASDLVFIIDAESRFTYANPSFYKTLGYEGKGLEKVKIQDILEWNESNETWMEAITGTSQEVSFRAASNRSLLMIGGGSLQVNSKQEVTGVRCIYLDVSEMRAYQEDAR